MRRTTRSIAPAWAFAIALSAGIAGAAAAYKVAEVDKDQYKVGVKYQPGVQDGATKTARLYVVAKGGWKINAKFPWEIVVTAPEGVSLTKSTLKKGDAQVMDEHKAVFKLRYKVSSAGSHQLKAKVKLSVCQGTTQCLFPTETLAWTVATEGD